MTTPPNIRLPGQSPKATMPGEEPDLAATPATMPAAPAAIRQPSSAPSGAVMPGEENETVEDGFTREINLGPAIDKGRWLFGKLKEGTVLAAQKTAEATKAAKDKSVDALHSAQQARADKVQQKQDEQAREREAKALKASAVEPVVEPLPPPALPIEPQLESRPAMAPSEGLLVHDGMGELAQDLTEREVLAEPAAANFGVAVSTPARLNDKRQPVVLIAAVVLALVLLVGGIAWWVGQPAEVEPSVAAPVVAPPPAPSTQAPATPAVEPTPITPEDRKVFEENPEIFGVPGEPLKPGMKVGQGLPPLPADPSAPPSAAPHIIPPTPAATAVVDPIPTPAPPVAVKPKKPTQVAPAPKKSSTDTAEDDLDAFFKNRGK